MAAIKSLCARQILDSRGHPTVEVDCVLTDGSFGRSAVPSGASTGSREALELRDGNQKSFDGKSVLKAVSNVNETLAVKLVGVSCADHRTVDQMMIDFDGTENKSRLGANAILGVSMALCRARAQSEGRPLWQSLADQFEVPCGGQVLLPVPLVNVLNGGVHADNGLSFQECMIVPTGFERFCDALRAGVEVFHALRELLAQAGRSTSVGDEGGFAPRLRDGREAFEFLLAAIEKAGYAGRMGLAVDAAASEFAQPASGVRSTVRYTVDGKTMTSAELTDDYETLCGKYPILSIEDSHHEDDWAGFQEMNARLGERVQLVGDDLYATNVKRIREGIEKKAGNAVLIKLNQIGTVSETVDAVKLAQRHGWRVIISHRSGETEDTFVAHLAVGLQAGQIKTGSFSRGERTCKYNELLRIEEKLGERAAYRSPF